MTNLTLFSQIVSRLDRNCFNRLVAKKETDKHQKGYNTRQTHMAYIPINSSSLVLDHPAHFLFPLILPLFLLILIKLRHILLRLL